jgi:hypothetical protein
VGEVFSLGKIETKHQNEDCKEDCLKNEHGKTLIRIEAPGQGGKAAEIYFFFPLLGAYFSSCSIHTAAQKRIIFSKAWVSPQSRYTIR